jgi:hypothetical protein
MCLDGKRMRWQAKAPVQRASEEAKVRALLRGVEKNFQGQIIIFAILCP